MWTVTDVFAPGIALGHVIGRFGCLFAGCCFGRPTTVPWAITFHSEYAARNVGTPLNQPAPPDAALRGRGGAADPRASCSSPSGRAGRSRAGRSGATCCSMASRASSSSSIAATPRGTVGMFSTSQFVSIVIVPIAIVMLIVLGRRAGPAPQAAARGGPRGMMPSTRSVHRERWSSRTSRTACGSTVPDRASARAVARADPAADQGGPGHAARRRRSGRARRSSTGQTLHRRCTRAARRDPGAGGAPAPHRLRRSGHRGARQAGRDGGAPGRGPQQWHARQRAAPSRQGSERHRRRAAARASCTGSIAERRA